MKNPASAGRKQGLSKVVRLAASDVSIDNLNPAPSQDNFAALRLARRFGLAPSTAHAVAELAGIGAQP